MEFSAGKVVSGLVNKWLNFGGDQYHDTGKTYLGKGICTVPVLLVYYKIVHEVLIKTSKHTWTW